jgi:hypothetical protein
MSEINPEIHQKLPKKVEIQISMSKNAIRIVLGRSRKKLSHKNKISNKIPKKRKEKSHHLSRMESAAFDNNSDRNVEVPKNSRNQGPSNAGEGSQGRHGGRHAPKRSSNPSYGPRRPGLAAAQHQSIEGQGLSMPIIAIQNAISWSNSEPQNKFNNTYHYIVLDNSLYYRVNNSKQSCNDSTNNANFLAEQKSTKNFQKRSKFSLQKFRKFRQISMSKNVLGRSREKFSHKNIISNKIPKKLLKHDNPNKTDALVVSADH